MLGTGGSWTGARGSSSLTSPVGVADGGTNITSYAVGDLIYASGTTTLSKLADVATGNALISGGVGVAPSYGKIGLTTHVSGILGVANGGSGTATVFTQGSVIFAGASGVYTQDPTLFKYDVSTGFLALGHNSALYRLHVKNNVASGSAWPQILMENTQDWVAGFAVKNGGGTRWNFSMLPSATYNSKFAFNVDGVGTYPLEVNTNGRVGINNQTPTVNAVNNLDIYGNICVGSGYAFDLSAPTNGAIIEGYVGINNFSPVHQLQINTANTYTIAGPDSGSANPTYGSGGYLDGIYTFFYRVYAYYDSPAGRVVSSSYTEMGAGSVGGSGDFNIDLDWIEPGGQSGFYVLASNDYNGYTYDYFVDVGNVTFWTDENNLWASDPVLTPTSASSTTFVVTAGSQVGRGTDAPLADIHSIGTSDDFGNTCEVQINTSPEYLDSAGQEDGILRVTGTSDTGGAYSKNLKCLNIIDRNQGSPYIIISNEDGVGNRVDYAIYGLRLTGCSFMGQNTGKQFRVESPGGGLGDATFSKLSLGVAIAFSSSRTPGAYLELGAGTTSITPILLTSGALKTSPAIGGVEFLTDKAYLTITTGTSRKEFALNDIALTTGRVALTTTNGRLTDSSSFTYSGSTMTINTLALTTALGIGSGGTGQTTSLAAFNALSPLTTRGDLLTRNTSNNIRLAIGAANTVLRSNGTDPSWLLFSSMLNSVITGTDDSPQVYAIGAITPNAAAYLQIQFIVSSGFETPCTIGNGSLVGQILILVGGDGSDTNTIYIQESDSNLRIYGDCFLYQGSTLALIWGGTKWTELYRNGKVN